MKEINIKSTTIEKSLDLAKDFLQSLVGPSFNELGQLFADNVKVWRVNNQLRNLEKVQRIIKNNKIETKQVNLKILFPYLEAVSFEDDENLQDMWANLFANYIDSKKNLNVIVYPDILKQLSTNEVTILMYVEKHGRSSGVYLSKYAKDITSSKDEVANLTRLGLLEEIVEIKDNSYSRALNDSRKVEYRFSKTDRYKLSIFGDEFLKACTKIGVDDEEKY